MFFKQQLFHVHQVLGDPDCRVSLFHHPQDSVCHDSYPENSWIGTCPQKACLSSQAGAARG